VRLWIQRTTIRESRHQCSFDSSAGLFAVFRALPRLLAPRHPPHALSSLAAMIPPSARDTRSRDKAGIGFPSSFLPFLQWGHGISAVESQGTSPRLGPRASNDPTLSRAHAERSRNWHAPGAETPITHPLRVDCNSAAAGLSKNVGVPEELAFTKLRCRSPAKDSCFLARRFPAARGFHDFSPPCAGEDATTFSPCTCAGGAAAGGKAAGASSTWSRPWRGMPSRPRPRANS
jgi:hypothetical protein